MVGPSLTDERRDALNARVRAAVVLVVAVSGAMVAVQADGSWQAIAAGTALGALVGYGAVRYLSALGREARVGAKSRRERRTVGGDDKRGEESSEAADESQRRRQRP